MDWNECLKKRVAKEVNKDEDLIKSLLKTSQNKLDSEEKLELNDVTSSSKISLLYDSLREILEVLALKNGFKIYNHECYTYFLKEILNESSKADEFDDLRKIRNSINYYEKEISIEETKEALERIKDLREEILKLTRKNCIIIHGSPDNEERAMSSEKRTYNKHWMPWVKKQLEEKGWKVNKPDMPHPWEKVY